MQIEGRDDDQPGTINSEISYRIVRQEPTGIGHMFRIDAKTGKLFVKESTLDREVTHMFIHITFTPAAPESHCVVDIKFFHFKITSTFTGFFLYETILPTSICDLSQK